MIISDPFGSWVTGAHEGLSDAMALRRAQDETAHANYGLQTAAQADPYRLQMLKNEAEMSNVNAQLYPQTADVGLKQRQEMLKHLQQQIAEGYGQYGISQPLIQDALKNYPGATVGEGGLSFPIQGAGGTQFPVATPFGQINDPRRQSLQAMTDYRNAVLGLRQEGVGVQQTREGRLGGRMNQGNEFSVLGGLGGNTMPAAPTLDSVANQTYPLPYAPKKTNPITPNAYGVQ